MNAISNLTSTDSFDDVLKIERDSIDQRRTNTGRTKAPELTGLALSGGGIRSAVFCLGVIQALAKNDILKNFDYLSTVSGGGYLGCALTWFTGRNATFGLNAQTLPYGVDDPLKPSREAAPLLAYLRRHGSYLTPNGISSLFAGIGVVLRGLVINLLVVWFPLVSVPMLGLRLAGYYAAAHAPWLHPWMTVALFFCLFVILSAFYSLFSGIQAKRHEDTPYGFRHWFERSMLPVLGLLGASVLLASLYYADYYAGIALHNWSASIGPVMTLAGSATGLWSRLIPRGDAADNAPSWVGPVAAGLLLYGFGLAAYQFAGYLLYAAPPCASIARTGLSAWIFVALLVGYLVDLNENTLHRFYRDRLMEAFMPDLGANNKPSDRGMAKDADHTPLWKTYTGVTPYHLINTHLVMNNVNFDDISKYLSKPDISKGLLDRWRIRGGDSFVFAPLFSGSPATGWHPTANNKALSKITLPTAMAISGAAVNPDAASSGVGIQRNRIFAAVMTLLNIRLGYWLANPRRAATKSHVAAPNHFIPGALSSLDQIALPDRYLELTDGGNFENLGVYELLRRKVKTIVVCDATADPTTAFADLQNLLSRAAADFQITINFPDPPLKQFVPAPQNGFPAGIPFAEQPFSVAKINFGDNVEGTLYYIKPAIFDGLQLNILGFKGACNTFPDDSTTNQFFDEARFEAYRALGFACVERMLNHNGIKKDLLDM